MRAVDICWRDTLILHSKKQKQASVALEQAKKPKEFSIKVQAINARLQLKIKNREGKVKLMQNYLNRMASLLG